MANQALVSSPAALACFACRLLKVRPEALRSQLPRAGHMQQFQCADAQRWAMPPSQIDAGSTDSFRQLIGIQTPCAQSCWKMPYGTAALHSQSRGTKYPAGQSHQSNAKNVDFGYSKKIFRRI
jgi:hypothetical protein